MAIAQVYEFRPRPGANEQFVANSKRADKIIRRLGGATRMHSTLVGATPNTFIYVIETPDWKAYGEFTAKLEADGEWRAFLAEVDNDKPAADMLTSAVYSEIPLG